MTDQKVGQGQTVPLNPNGFTKTGYTFSGWALTPTGEVEYTDGANVSNLAPSGTITLYAVWTANPYTIEFDGNGHTGGEVMSPQPMTYDQAANLKANAFSKTGYSFSGWALTAGGAVEHVDQASVTNLAESGTITLYAVWTANSYEIEFNGNGSTSGTMANQAMTYDVAANLNANQYIKTGYTFSGWALTAGGAVAHLDQASVTNLATSGTVTLYAVWQVKTYTITLNLNGGVLPLGYDETTYLQYWDFPYTLPVPIKTLGGGEYEFLGWYTENSTAGTKYEVLTVDNDYTLYAIWGKPIYYIGEYPQTKVTDAALIATLNGITPVTTSKVLTTSKGSAHTEIWHTVTHLGDKYEKVGSDYFKYEPIACYKLSDGTYYSKYILDHSPFDQAQTGVTTNIYDYSYVKKYLEQVLQDKSGVSLVGLMSVAQLQNVTDFADNNARKTTTTDYAFATMTGARGKITSFNAYYAPTSSSGCYWTNTPHSSYGNMDQCIDKTGQVTYTSANVVYGLRVTIKANYTIDFDENGATSGSTASQNVNYFENATLNSNGFSKTGYTFMGWATTPTGSVEYLDGASVYNLATSGTVTLYAKWTANTYTIEFNGNGVTGGSTANQDVIYDETTILNPNGFTRVGYNFAGWALTADGAIEYGNEDLVTNLVTSGTVTLYAVWESLLTYYIGEYPQRKVTDSDLITTLNGLTPVTSSQTITTSQGKSHNEVWHTVTYNGTKYEKVGSDYYQYEPIKCYKLSDGKYYSDLILDYSPFDEYVDPYTTVNVYDNSYIKRYLEQVLKTKAGVSAVVLLSQAQLLNSSNFVDNSARKAISSDYALAAMNGARGKITSFSVTYNASHKNSYWTNTAFPSLCYRTYIIPAAGNFDNFTTSRVHGIRIVIEGEISKIGYYKGKYPQTKVTDSALITTLNEITPVTSSKTITTSHGKSHNEIWHTVTHNGVKYEKVGSNYYKYELIEFFKLADGTYYSKYILDYAPFDEYISTGITTNIYNNSYIKKYLEQVLNAKASLADINLLSQAQVTNTANFANDNAKKTIITDYADAVRLGNRGLFTNFTVLYSANYLNRYWLNTPHPSLRYCSYNVNKDGVIQHINVSAMIGTRIVVSE